MKHIPMMSTVEAVPKLDFIRLELTICPSENNTIYHNHELIRWHVRDKRNVNDWPPNSSFKALYEQGFSLITFKPPQNRYLKYKTALVEMKLDTIYLTLFVALCSTKTKRKQTSNPWIATPTTHRSRWTNPSLSSSSVLRVCEGEPLRSCTSLWIPSKFPLRDFYDY